VTYAHDSWCNVHHEAGPDWCPGKDADMVARYLHQQSALGELITWERLPPPLQLGWRDEARKIVELVIKTRSEHGTRT